MIIYKRSSQLRFGAVVLATMFCMRHYRPWRLIFTYTGTPHIAESTLRGDATAPARMQALTTGS